MASISSLTGSSSSSSSIYGNRNSNIISGLASGMDTEALISGAVQGYQQKIQSLQQKNTKLQWQQEAIQSVSDKLVEFARNYTSYAYSTTNLMSSSFFSNAVKTTANGIYAAMVTASGKSSSEVVINSIKQLATTARYTVSGSDLSGGIHVDSDNKKLTASGSEALDLSGEMKLSKLEGSLSLTYGTKEITIEFDELDLYADESGNLDAETFQAAIEKKLSEQKISTSSGTSYSADTRIGVSVSDDGQVSFYDKTGSNTVSVSGATGSLAGMSTLNTQGDVIFSGVESIVQSLNSKYDNGFIFGGADTQNPPFAIETVGDKHYLTYRNVRIDDPDPNYYTQPYHDADGNEVLDKDGNALTNQQMLDSWKDEHMYVDIGIGFQLDKDGKVVDSTAFDSAISGVDFVGGSGLDADGDPNNVVSIMLRLSEIFQDYDQESQTWGAAGDKEDAQRLLNKLKAAQDDLSNQHTELDTQAKFLETNQSQLESTFYSLNTELNSVEKIDEVEAILTLVSAQTSYNAAIQVGANVVPQSLMDYLN